MPYSCLIPGNIKMARRFHADFTQNGLWNRSGMVAKSKRHRSAILAKSIYALSVLDTRQHEDFTQISRRFPSGFTLNRLRNRSGIVAES